MPILLKFFRKTEEEGNFPTYFIRPALPSYQKILQGKKATNQYYG